MRGAIAAGHRLTAEAGAEILAEGGNAVDACLAATFASWVTESPLTGPAGGGFLLVHRARDRTDRLLDFFVALPGRGADREAAEMELVDVVFDGSSSQSFHLGAPSCAVPGVVAGLEAAHRRYATLPWRRLIEPAIALARDGFELNASQGYLHSILDSILRLTPEGNAIYGPERPLREGERLVMADLASTLEQLADGGAQELYVGELGRTIVRHVQEHGGIVTAEDLADYRVVWRRPIRARYGGRTFVSNPPPSSGGVLIGYGLALLDRLAAAGAPGSAEAMNALVSVMREQERARGGAFATGLHRGGLARRLLSEESVAAAVERIEAGEDAAREPAGAPGTTHVSVVDERGNAASLTASTGAGSGVFVPGTGLQLNNMLGEPDLNPQGRTRTPGARLTSMMAPSLVLEGDRPRLVVGSAGSTRLRGAILQVAVNVLHHALPLAEAIDSPRVHLDEDQVHCEGGCDPGELDRLARMGWELVRWQERNLYFGGVSAVERLADGSLAAAGDPRRGGHGIVVAA